MSSDFLNSQRTSEELMELMPPTDDRRPLVVGITCFLWALSTMGVLMRFIVRLKRHIHGWEDYILYLSWAGGILGIPDAVFITRAGLGLHIIYLTPQGISDMLKWASIGQIQVVIGVALVRFSVCLLILRLIDRTHRKTHWFLYGIMVVNFVVSTVGLFLIIFQCQPFAKRYDPTIPGKCFDVRFLTYSVRVRGALGCVLDFACVAACFVLFRNLQVQRRVKWTTIVLMSFGVITAACSIGKAVTSEYRDADFSWGQVSVYLWSGAEQYLGIFVTCLPTARPFVLDVSEAGTYISRLLNSRGRVSGSSLGEPNSSKDPNTYSEKEIENARPERLSSKHSL